MGFRFRKSINLGGGFRVNLSKSGVGYSWGTKGVRFTKTAKGKRRTTLSIPGTGISYVTESNGTKITAPRQPKNTTNIPVQTISDVTVSILTSGSALTVVGLLLGYLSANGLLAQLGIFLGRGAIFSLFIVFFVLPGLLMIFDKLIIRNLKNTPIQEVSKS